MQKPAPRTLEVIRGERVTPNMQRITLGGDGMGSFPKDQDGSYIKLIFPQESAAKPVVRTYTVSAQRPDEIDVDFALHSSPGPASAWSLSARAGDQILVGGPGPKKLINPSADWFLLAGDMTALPAIKVAAQYLPENAKGYLVLEVLEKSDVQTLEVPAGIDVQWIVNAAPGLSHTPLLDQVKQLDWLSGQAAAWVACEFHSMRALRKYLKFERQLTKDYLYISSYWKMGRTEDQHKIDKREDSIVAEL